MNPPTNVSIGVIIQQYDQTIADLGARLGTMAVQLSAFQTKNSELEKELAKYKEVEKSAKEKSDSKGDIAS